MSQEDSHGRHGLEHGSLNSRDPQSSRFREVGGLERCWSPVMGLVGFIGDIPARHVGKVVGVWIKSSSP